MKREKGHYWVRKDLMWMIAEWNAYYWYVCGLENRYSDIYFEEIDERRVERDTGAGYHTPITGHSPFDRYMDKLLDGNINSEIDLSVERKTDCVTYCTTLRAIDPCVMDLTEEATLTIGKDYTVVEASETKVRVIDDGGVGHWFTRDTLGDYFVVVRD